jgi:hypothetical protein
VFLCEKENSTSELRQAMTKQLDKLLIECARKLNDGRFWLFLMEVMWLHSIIISA